jgi:hypothetical protein
MKSLPNQHCVDRGFGERDRLRGTRDGDCCRKSPLELGEHRLEWLDGNDLQTVGERCAGELAGPGAQIENP